MAAELGDEPLVRLTLIALDRRKECSGVIVEVIRAGELATDRLDRVFSTLPGRPRRDVTVLLRPAPPSFSVTWELSTLLGGSRRLAGASPAACRVGELEWHRSPPP
ncbi:MAG TPA: hypothetical protein PLP31_01525 [Thermoanaerobaculaceae bacterium]|nr:hypothetical protein [Thermoanaerobaculaceae bacterium]